MAPERLREIEQLFDAARRDRAVLEKADPGLRREVESLLAQQGSLPDPWIEATAAAPLPSNTQLGPYRIEFPLGAGGMGQVYKAHDTRLGRSVAVKVVHAHFSDRFEREARAIAALNHPHICTLHDIGPNYLVMELCEGETLAGRLKRGKLSLGETARLGAQIADALAAAHAGGVIHRDLKPGNIMLTASGVKVLDFGLAKSREDESITAARAVLGTPAYMAPEQREGRVCDARTDIYALGLILGEMATGKRRQEGDPPFQGDQQERFAHIVEHCLAADPDARWQSARDIQSELEWAARSAAIEKGRTRHEASVWRAALPWVTALAALAVGMILMLITGRFRAQRPAQNPVRFVLTPPEGTTISYGYNSLPGGMNTLALSADGRSLVFAAADSSGKSSLWIRALDSLSARRLENTEDARFPFWSPDGQFIAYFAGGNLMSISPGGAPQEICKANGFGGAWGRDGTIVFSAASMGGPPANESRGPLYRVSAAGGLPTPVTVLDVAGGELSHSWPQFLPDGRRVLYWSHNVKAGKSGIYVQEIASSARKLLLNTDRRAVYSATGHLLTVRDQTLLAQPFNLDRLEVTGEPMPLSSGVEGDTRNGIAAYASSENGVLAVHSLHEQILTKLVWHSRNGEPTPVSLEPAFWGQIALSPDQKRVALLRRDGDDSHGSDVWVLELATGILSRLTFDPPLTNDIAWSPDSRRIIAVSLSSSGKGEIREITVSSGATSLLYSDPEPIYFDDWSRDGRFLLYHQSRAETSILLLPLDGERKPRLLAHTPFQWDQAHFSPDGRWIAYNSNETGRYQVYIASLPSLAEKRQITRDGGGESMWRADGRELYYLTLDGKLMAVDLKFGATIEAGLPHLLFQTNVRVPELALYCWYSPSADGQRFLIREWPKAMGLPQVQVVVHWNAR